MFASVCSVGGCEESIPHFINNEVIMRHIKRNRCTL